VGCPFLVAAAAAWGDEKRLEPGPLGILNGNLARSSWRERAQMYVLERRVEVQTRTLAGR
jgi:hypothetical protein